MGHFSQTQGTGKPRASLERMQDAQHFSASAQVVGSPCPLPQRTAELRKQFEGLFFKDREEVGIQCVHRVDVIVGNIYDHLRGCNVQGGRRQCDRGNTNCTDKRSCGCGSHNGGAGQGGVLRHHINRQLRRWCPINGDCWCVRIKWCNRVVNSRLAG